MKILVLNAGSSSQKSALYALDGTAAEASEPLWEASVDWSHQADVAELKIKTAAGNLHEEIPATDRSQVMIHLLETLWQGKTQVIQQPSDIQAVGHRVVHGGQDYSASVVITPDVKQTIARLADLAPAHNPANLEGIEAIEKILPDVPQVAVFDTAFHAQLPTAASTYPGPYDWLEQGIRRYGFHGISHQYCAQRTAHILGRDLSTLKLITCHLGNGCSLAAIDRGRSVDTTMGFTPLDGLMMGSRSGAVDPGILIYLLRQGHTADRLDKLLNKESGLKGVSGISGDMRQITHAIAEGNDRAQLAFDVYVHRLRFNIGGMLATLGGLDALVFTAGVGENQATVRELTCQAFEFLGLKLDHEKNRQSPVDQDIATPDSIVRVVVVHTQEDWAIAQECWRLLGAS
ncbi:acetate kinase [Leptolyngbya sp. FACHB-36]|uniref:acetate/propionate family kinase n=1 Tax=Leptolyngbya sp. FACHB-36 TaxID=2692808 RepID=UPI001680D4A0|nr:acetate kinase [Leptolyngbya sp. FACHB-36]MBD2021615.1 acetate kinase [Leptolyngbya sp. FACHB-36]